MREGACHEVGAACLYKGAVSVLEQIMAIIGRNSFAGILNGSDSHVPFKFFRYIVCVRDVAMCWTKIAILTTTLSPRIVAGLRDIPRCVNIGCPRRGLRAG